MSTRYRIVGTLDYFVLFLDFLDARQPSWLTGRKFRKVNAGCLIRSIVDDGIHGSKPLCGQDNQRPA